MLGKIKKKIVIKKYLSLRIFKKTKNPIMKTKNESKINHVILNPNTYKNKATHPDYIGKMFLIDKDYKISAWENKDSHGKQYYSLSVQIFEEKPKQHKFKILMIHSIN